MGSGSDNIFNFKTYKACRLELEVGISSELDMADSCGDLLYLYINQVLRAFLIL